MTDMEDHSLPRGQFCEPGMTTRRGVRPPMLQKEHQHGHPMSHCIRTMLDGRLHIHAIEKSIRHGHRTKREVRVEN